MDDSTQPTVPSAPRVTPNAFHALGGIWRLTTRRFFTVNYWLVLAGLLAVLVVLSIPAASNEARAQQRLLSWAAGFYVCFLVPLLSFISAAGSIREDQGAASVDYILTRPVRRPWFVLFRYLANVGAAQISFLFGLLTIVALAIFWGVSGWSAALPRLFLGQFCAIVLFSAVGLLCGTITSRYVIVGLLYGVVVEIPLNGVPTPLHQISLLRHLLAIVQPVLGSGGWGVSRYDGTEVSATLTTPLVLIIVPVAAIALTAILFSFREFAGASGRDN